MCSITRAGVRRHGTANSRGCTTEIQSAISNSGISAEGGLVWKLVEAEGQSHHGFVRESALPDAGSRRILIHDSFSRLLTKTSKSVGTVFAPRAYCKRNLTSHTARLVLMHSSLGSARKSNRPRTDHPTRNQRGFPVYRRMRCRPIVKLPFYGVSKGMEYEPEVCTDSRNMAWRVGLARRRSSSFPAGSYRAHTDTRRSWLRCDAQGNHTRGLCRFRGRLHSALQSRKCRPGRP